ncbi:MAG: outer membrane protein transport protein [Luteolibacter sp.]|jgi:long-chain fatty acid transport protein|nr:outer membrane protein transport protein [Luteolibacter sp.]
MNLPRITVIALFAGTPNPLQANGFRLVSQDAYAAARGEAFAATADNPSAIHYNPAGISQLEGHQFRMGAYALHYNPTFQAPEGLVNAGETYEIEEKDAIAPQLYYTYGIHDSPLTLGLGVYAPHGASVTWPQETGFRAVTVDGELTYLRINPVASLELRPGLSFALGVMIDDASIAMGQGLSRRITPFNEFRFEGDAFSAGYNMGLLWQINKQWSVGATYRSKNRLNFEGETDIQQPPFQRAGTSAEMELEFPSTTVFGISYRPTEKWNIEFNADYSDWSTIDTTTIRQSEKPRGSVQQDIPVTLDWKDSWILKFGATRYFDEGWYASGGYVFNENSVPTGYYSPLAADLDRHFLTLGLGRQWSRYTVDLAYQYGFAPARTVTGSVTTSKPGNFAGQNADGKYDFTSHALLLSFGVKF